MQLDEYRDVIDLTPYPRPALLRTEEEKDGHCDTILKFLLRERGMIAAFSASYAKKRQLIRNYMNERMPLPIPKEILTAQDELFYTETVERGIVDVQNLEYSELGLTHFRGDITTLNADAIVNACNSSLLGCFLPGHNCIDNVIHSYAGMQLRDDCAKIIAKQGHEEECGNAKVTRAYNLPSKYVLHTVGPRVGRELTQSQRLQLRACYTSCLDLAEELRLETVAFCCLSTGVFNFPQEEAAEIATGTVLKWKLQHSESKLKVIFNTFLARDAEIYRNILKMM